MCVAPLSTTGILTRSYIVLNVCNSMMIIKVAINMIYVYIYNVGRGTVWLGLWSLNGWVID